MERLEGVEASSGLGPSGSFDGEECPGQLSGCYVHV
jgi:hypothetical protein